MANENGAIGWDDDVSESEVKGGGKREDFVVLPDGEYPFAVAKVERGTFAGSKKVPPCNKVDVGVIIDGGDKGRSYVTKMFLMHTTTLGFIYEFLTSLGLHKKGEGAGPIPWGKVQNGMEGRCKVSSRTYTTRDGESRTSNEVKKWLAPAAASEQSGLSDDLDDLK